MGMTINDTISILKTLKNCTFSYMREYHAFITAIKTMRKYQKIEKIIRNYDSTWEFHNQRDTIDKIKDVLEEEPEEDIDKEEGSNWDV